MFKRQVLVMSLLLLVLGKVEAAPLRPVSEVTPAQAETLMRERANVFLLDVRTLGEYSQVRIAAAQLIPIDQVVARVREIPRDRPVLVYCAVGSRSSQVAGYLAQLGYAEVYNMSGGIMGWQVRGYPVLRGAP